ncbi:MAG: bifunctional phosphoglucose/phosphomannose isomerase [Thermoleophilia bacterium]|nr:bifunctional phosphoglucose/phosphomannose isomerase [Thermoleophilia bacterium]
MTIPTLDTLLVHDVADMLGAVATLPGQLPDGLARANRVRDALTASWPSDRGATPRTLVVCGMGGSGVGADLLPAAADVRAPVVAVKGYELPGWVTDEDRVVCISYSGATAETLACFDQALERSVVAAVITSGGELANRARAADVPVVELPGGGQPRAAVGVIFGALAGVAAALGVVVDPEALVREAAEGAALVVDEHVGTGPEHGGDQPPALELARQLHDHAIVVYGAGHTVAVAHRWKAQVNENGKVPCFANALPELDHNELVGWEFARATGARWALVELLPLGASEAITARFDITRRLMSDAIDVDLRFEPRSTTLAGATFEQLAWGDYVSVYLALVRGIDPSPVERIQSLKGELGGR